MDPEKLAELDANARTPDAELSHYEREDHPDEVARNRMLAAMEDKDLSRGMREIQTDATSIVYRRLLGAIESCEWVTVHNLADQLKEVAWRGMHRATIDKVLPTLKTTHQEREAR